MRVSLKWLNNYVGIDIEPDRLAEALTMVGLEVENIENLGQKYNKFVVGRILEVARHPNADRLSLCRVDIGKEALQIVCGAPNVARDQIVPIGLAGATVPHNQHDPEGKPFMLSTAKVRGVESQGMICSAYELDLGDDKEGILVLGVDEGVKTGTPLASYLGLDDYVFEIGVTPNRSDALCHIGIAREIAALQGRKLRWPRISIEESRKRTSRMASIRIEAAELCPRYSARLVFGVQIVPSPDWLKNLLLSVGIRPINIIVDITNYVLMECGQPLHAFDYDRLEDHTIVVKRAGEIESFVTLDGKKRTLRSDTLMICDSKRPVAIAGVMGGENSEISASTRNILIESAYFDPRSIRKTAKHLGLSTDASQRFERGTDPNITSWAADRAASLIQELVGGEIPQGCLDVYPKKIRQKSIRLRVSKTNEVLGTNLAGWEIYSLLRKIQLEPLKRPGRNNADKPLTVRVPTFRPDLEREIDLIEEVARVFGYDNIETKSESLIRFSTETPSKEWEEEIQDSLVGRGFHEVVANSMQERSIASLGGGHMVQIANPISKEMASLRTSLIPGVLQVIRHNIFHGMKDLSLFEFGKVYLYRPGSSSEVELSNFVEEDRLILARTGVTMRRSWDGVTRQVDLQDLRGEIETLMERLRLDKVEYIPYSTSDALAKPGLRLEIEGEEAGFVGKIEAELLSRFEVEQDVFVAELKLDTVLRNIQVRRCYEPLPRYPVVNRDLALVVDRDVAVGEIEREIRAAGSPLLTGIELFDIYVGDQIGSGKKSCAFAIEFQSRDHTLTQEEVDTVMQGIISGVSTKLNASLRT